MNCEWPRFFSIGPTDLIVFSTTNSNRRVPCKSGIIPSIDLSKWKESSVDAAEYSEGHGNHVLDVSI